VTRTTLRTRLLVAARQSTHSTVDRVNATLSI